MIQATLQTDKGPIGLICINSENWVRLKAGMPLDIDIKAITPPGTRMNRVIIHYADTYEQAVEELDKGDFEIPESMWKEARNMDIVSERSRRQRNRRSR